MGVFLYFDKLFATTFVDLYRIVFRENSRRSRSTQYTYVTILNRRSTFNKMIYQKWKGAKFDPNHIQFFVKFKIKQM